ncbi:MATH and LRR domain-containing protein PFE0570w isoform X1 [Vespa crabro]|uniref:MATH and LRR domain-containing protein PFE0570w isoform X1 n=1 Tax=Vespa crabro TaxID=7445 RepID=UPI001F01AE68|nr:MATH and LRR domain-containing protein PFE0570w isoform X1 [Vespa crabro]
MLRKPIRTYQRRNIPNPLIKISDFAKVDLTLKTDDILKEQYGIDNVNENKISEDSLDYDPFETTFDRIAKDAVVPAIPPDCIDNNSWSGSSSDINSEEENINESLFHISFCNSNVSVSPNMKYTKSLKMLPYKKNVKPKNKKTSITGALYNSQHTKEIRNVKKKNQTKACKSKRIKKIQKTKNKKQCKSNNGEILYSVFKNSNDQLYESDIVNANINRMTNNENINNSTVPYKNIHKKNTDLLHCNKCELYSPLRKTTNISKINDKKKICRLTSIKKTQKINNENNENFSLTSSVSHNIPDSMDNKFKIKPCSVVLYKNNIEKCKFMVNESKYILKECHLVLHKISSNSINSKYKSPINDLICKNSNSISKDLNSEKNPVSSTPIIKCKRRSAYSPCYSPIDITKSHAISDIPALLDQLQSNNLHILDETSINASINVESDMKDKILYIRDRKIRNSTSVDNLSSSEGIKLDIQEPEILHLSISKQNSNFINNRKTYATIFMDDSIDIALKQKYNKTHLEDNPLLNSINFSIETNRSCSLFDDHGSKLYVLENDNSMSAIKEKSFTNMNVHENNDNTELKLKPIISDIYNTEKIIKSEILKKEEPLITITKEKSNEEHIENEDTIEERSHGKSMDENQCQLNMNETINFFTRLKHSVKVTERKQPDRKRNFYLSNICENENDIMQYSTCEMSQYNEKVNEHILNQDPTKNVTDTSVNIITQCDEPNLLINEQMPSLSGKFIFLKPGKSWTRSLSILHNFQNGLNLNRTSTEKGKRWRHSVKDILDMQKKDECDTNQFINLKRFVRRTSIRVVCDNRIIKNASDTSFLEVYGIKTTVNNEHILPETSCNTEYSTQHNDMENNCAEICSSGTAKDVILQKCSQKHYLPFRDLFSTKYLKFCRKIGEGVYGEVFLYEKDTQKSVLKIIPIEGVQLVNGESQKKFDEILSEIVIAKELHNLRFNKNHNTSGFVEVKSIKCIEGKYPEKMINLWKKYDEEKTSDNDCPSIFDEKQLYISLELGHGGQDLESFEFHTAVEAYALFIQATLALAVAERSLKFEHRDLHWGNILISHTDEQYIYYKLDNKDISVSSNGIKVCIIDFTLSRMSYQGCCIFNDLALDPALFTAQGEYQFEIYRLMKDKVQNNWQEFEPYTNILWLHYVLDKMLTMVRYKKKNLKKHKNALIQLYNLKHVILSYQSAFDFVNNCQQISNLLIK